MSQEKTKKCDNCEKEIPLSKIFLHERFCAQNVKKCSICKIPIIIEDEEEHMTEFHNAVECELCHKSFPPTEINSHIPKCLCRMVECQFCELQIMFKDKKEHEDECGSKTELCPKCNTYVQIRNFEIHRISECHPEAKISDNLVIEDRATEKAMKKQIKELEKEKKKTNITKIKVGNNFRNDSKQNINIAKNKEDNPIMPTFTNQRSIGTKSKTVKIAIKTEVNKETKENTNNPKSMLNRPINQNPSENSVPTISNQRAIGTKSKTTKIEIKPDINKNNKNTSTPISNQSDNQNQKTINNINKPPFANQMKFGPNQKKISQSIFYSSQTNPASNKKSNDNSTESSMRETKTSFKFKPDINMKEIKHNPISNDYLPKNPSQGKSNKKKQPFDWKEYEGDYLMDDEIEYDYDNIKGNKSTDGFSLEEQQLNEVIQRSLKQK